MFTFAFLINLVLTIFLALVLNYITYQLYIIILRKNKFIEKKILFFKSTFKGHFLSFLIITLSIVTVLYTKPSSYTFYISNSLAIFGPITVGLIGLIKLVADAFYNFKLIKKIRTYDI